MTVRAHRGGVPGSQIRSLSGVLKTREPRVRRSKRFIVNQRKGLSSQGAVAVGENHGPTNVGDVRLCLVCLLHERSSERWWRHGLYNSGGGLLRASRLSSGAGVENERAI